MTARKKPGKTGQPSPRRSGKQAGWPWHIKLLLALLLALLLLVLVLAVPHAWRSGRRAQPAPAATAVPPAPVSASVPAAPAPRRPPPRPAAQAAPAPTAPVARLAIVMDDLGRDLATARALAEIDLAVTFAILPDAAAATAVAELAHRSGREVLLHLPMEPENYPAADPGPAALWLRSSEAEVRQLLDGYLRRVPHAVGGNNHMGSRFTADREAMGRVLRELRARRLFFLDSVTTPASVAYAEAGRIGLRRGRRDVFLDNEAALAPIRGQLRKLADLAERRGTAIGICHPYPATLEALRREVAELKRRRIAVVPVSQLLEGG